MTAFASPARWALDVSDLTKFDPVTAHLCAWASYYAYYENAADWFRDVLGATDILKMPAIPESGIPQGWIFTLPECNIVVIPGTTNYSQLYGILRAQEYSTMSEWNNGSLVGLRYATAASTFKAAFQSVITAKINAKKTIFCGHSYGGAIAAVLWAKFAGSAFSSAQPRTCYTFGSPRAGNDRFRILTSETFNVIVPGDIVPALPPTGSLFLAGPTSPSNVKSCTPADPYQNHGTPHYVNQQGQILSSDPGTQLKALSPPSPWDAIAAFPAFLSPLHGVDKVAKSTSEVWDEAIDLHLMNNYLSRLEKALPERTTTPDALGKNGKIIESQLQETIDPGTFFKVFPPVGPAPSADPGTFPVRGRRPH